MNILVISGSPRKGGNTEIMVQAFAEGARESGNQVVVKEMSGLKVAPCLACEYCFTHDGVCVQKDDMTAILEEVDRADMLVFASPIYWFGMAAQVKAVIDRLYARAKRASTPLKRRCCWILGHRAYTMAPSPNIRIPTLI